VVVDSQIRRTCETVLHALELPVPFTIDAFCVNLGRDRGRPVRLRTIPADVDTPCGLWVSTGDGDYVFHQTATSPLHQEHIILHELAHMIFDHTRAGDSSEDLRRELLPDLDPKVVGRVLARTSYDSLQEQEAETLADLIGAQAHRTSSTSRGKGRFARAREVFGPAS
jgi:hypothetical protein